jgi:putative acyl-CoA dehydrogenase
MSVNEKMQHATHEVLNQPPVLEDYNLFETDQVLKEGLGREGGAWALARVSAFGRQLGSREFLEHGAAANRNVPELHTHDRFGHRIDEVRFHPSYHTMMWAGMAAGVHSFAWTHEQPGAFVARNALAYLLAQVEAGVGCPLTMTCAVVPALRHQPDVAEEWLPRIFATEYDERFIPASEKRSATMGMAMTEKQGGSDVRTNTTAARAIGARGPGEEYELTGHKWFVSAPMSDAFLALAQSEDGLSCFMIPRWLPDGTRNTFMIQRLKDKVGNRSNASSEVELQDTWARMVGEEGRGVRTIMEMVQHTRLDCVGGSAALMRQALVQAIHHCRHREAFGRLLIDQPLMQNVLADMAIESEAATLLLMRLARAFDEARADPVRAPFARIATAIGKFWVCKRAPGLTYEAMECLGGNGYVEESNLPRLYREAPVNSIWEGSGNVMCLDVLRAMRKEPACVDALRDELLEARGADRRYDALISDIETILRDPAELEHRARSLVEKMALGLQASLVLRHSPGLVASAFCATRLESSGHVYGTLPRGLDAKAIIARAAVEAD